MYFAIYPTKDNTISNLSIRGINKSASNSGQSEILELYNLTESSDRRGVSRILLYFDLNNLSESIVNEELPTSSVEYRLKLKNANHRDTVPYSYDLKVFPLSQSWDEGRGLSMEDEDLKDLGVSNWFQATSQQNWSILGASFFSASHLTASQHFDFGTEDLNVDISNIVYAWLTGNLPNHGLLIKFDNFYETSTNNYYIKKFFARHALVPERRPKIEALSEKFLQDDRSEFPYNFSGALAYYRYIGGLYDNIAEPLFVDIINSSSTTVQTLTASKYENGVYQISGVLIHPTSSTQVFRDVWFTPTQQLFTGTFEPVYVTGSQLLNFDIISVSIPNLKPVYFHDEKVIIRVFAKEKDYKLAVVREGQLEPNPILIKKAYFQIENANNNEVIIPFSTGSNKFSKLSYDLEGNYFKFWTSSLIKDNVYRIKILADYNEKRYIFAKNEWIFKIE